MPHKSSVVYLKFFTMVECYLPQSLFGKMKKATATWINFSKINRHNKLMIRDYFILLLRSRQFYNALLGNLLIFY